jgi:hypothetical protein
LSARVAVLYEDERNTQIRDYPMHRLVCMTLADMLGVDHRDVEEQFHGSPVKGNGNLKRACESVSNTRDRSVVIIIDSDKLARLLDLPKTTARAAQLAELARRYPDSRLQVLLLERNTESLIDAAAKCLGRETPERKNKLVRDQMLASAAWAAATVRTCIHDSMPSFAEIIKALMPLFVPSRRPTEHG